MADTSPPRIALARLATPLEPLDRISKEAGGPRIWVKRDDLTGSDTSGNKVRKLEFSLGEALAQGCDTVITCGGLQSNHCRATAACGARLGLNVHLILRGLPGDETPDGNLFLDHLFGAEISCYPPEEYAERRDVIFREIAADYAKKRRKAFAIPTGASDEIGIWGYVEACKELKADCAAHGFAPEHLVCAAGSCGTLAGLIAGNALHGLGAAVWGVDIDDDPTEEMRLATREYLRKWKARYGQVLDTKSLPVEIIEGYVGPGYGRAGPEVFATIERLARTEGIALDPVYTGKTFHGLLSEIGRGRFAGAENLVFIHTGGIFGLMAQRGAFGYGPATRS